MFLPRKTENNNAQQQIEIGPWDAHKTIADESIQRQNEAESMQTIEEAPVEASYKYPVYKPLNDGGFRVQGIRAVEGQI
jgi:hypothetical protein